MDGKRVIKKEYKWLLIYVAWGWGMRTIFFYEK